MDDGRQSGGNPWVVFVENGLIDPGQPYHWGSVGPGALTVERTGAMVPVSAELLADALPPIDLAEMLRREAIHHRAMRRLKLADPTGYDRLQTLIRWAEAARQDREAREAEARRCPHCGCDPQEHPDRDDW
jgi:hypothetical protein